MFTETDKNFMDLALQLAARARGYVSPNPMVGCVITQDQIVIGQGYHHQCGDKHAEVNAIENALNIKTKQKLKGATCYVSLEPCCHFGKTAPCVDAIISSGITKVIIAMQDPNPIIAGRGIELLKQAGLEVRVGLYEQRAQELNAGFVKRMQQQQPFITSKIALSLDGAVALHNGESRWITNELCRKDVHKLRAAHDAIVTTAATVIADNPSLNARLEIEEFAHSDYDYIKQPLRVVIDKNLQTDPKAQVYTLDNNCIVITANDLAQTAKEKITAFESQGIKVYCLDYITVDGIADKRLDIQQLWLLLAELGCNNVLVEAGSVFNSHLLKNNFVDNWVIYQSGVIMGTGSKQIFSSQEMAKADSMQDLIKLKCKSITQIGDNWRLICSQE